ncbi:MAG: hypothetical protein MAG581_01907 [Deltaproteobacteria bacterium]|jgi:hypothetical protein|nr:hypothetical protein [Deltaproteobacteria bacterium]
MSNKQAYLMKIKLLLKAIEKAAQEEDDPQEALKIGQPLRDVLEKQKKKPE